MSRALYCRHVLSDTQGHCVTALTQYNGYIVPQTVIVLRISSLWLVIYSLKKLTGAHHCHIIPLLIIYAVLLPAS